jgi:uncharacterized protein
MTLALDTAIAPATRRDIQARLDRIEADHDVRLLMAVESGSRAWGFPSPDSDYDVRFVYVRPRDWYLSLRPGRDVIETPIIDEIDLGGWDVRKALGLLLKSNAVVSEWIESPIRYRADDPFVARLAGLADAVLDPRALAHHYANLGGRDQRRRMDRGDGITVKAYLYALRSALSIRALRLDPGTRPPMNLQALIAVADLPDGIVAQIDDLVLAKSRANERATGTHRPGIDALIAAELASVANLPVSQPRPDLARRADQLFLDLVST